ncbi:MAG: hypothetical protein RL642_995 [Bacteroidota bacterium]
MKIKSLAIIVFILLLAGCKKQSIELNFEPIENFFPIKKGSAITYRYDSTAYNGINNAKSINTYLVRDVLDSSITDNLGKISFVFKRSIRNQIDTTKWELLSSYRVTIDSNKLYLTENNLRFIKLVNPIREGYSWNGNSFINVNENSGLDYYQGWEYTYGKPNEPLTINTIPFASTLTVLHKNDTIGNPTDRKQYSSILFSKEIYAKEVGLIYKEFLKETWQPPNSNNPNGYFEKNSFGIKMSVLSTK